MVRRPDRTGGEAAAALHRAQTSVDYGLLELKHGPTALDRVLIARALEIGVVSDDGPWMAELTSLVLSRAGRHFILRVYTHSEYRLIVAAADHGRLHALRVWRRCLARSRHSHT